MLPSDLQELIGPYSSADLICGSGSNRSYWRVTLADGSEIIATQGTNAAENEAFFYLADKLAAGGINVPRVLAISPNRLSYTQTSLGDKALFELLPNDSLVTHAIELLARVHSIKNIDYSRCYPVSAMDRRSIFWDLNYFKYCFLKTTPGIEINEPALEDDFETLADILLQAQPRALMLRDFQSRNLILSPSGHLGLIDFQGGRLGPVHYDVASFLWQARANFPDSLRQRMVSHYCTAAGLDEAEFRQTLPYVVVFRLLQVLGAYGFRGRWELKEHFLKSIPPALESLKQAIALTPALPYLQNLTDRLNP